MTDSLTQLQAAAAGGDSQAQFQLGLVLARQGQIQRAITWYQRAADRQHPGALRELGLIKRFAINGPADIEGGLALIGAAAALDDADAHYWLAHWKFANDADLVDAHQLLLKAADAGHAIAHRNLGLIAASKGCVDDARSWLTQAESAGDTHSSKLLAAMDANGTGDHIEQTRSDSIDSRTLPPIETLSTDPYVAICDDVFSPLDCVHLIELGRRHLKPSMTVSSQNDRVIHSDYRTSSSVELESFVEDPWALMLQRGLCELVGATLPLAEPLTLLRYEPGQEYRPHRDYLSPASLSNPTGRRSGQRISTIFVYLAPVEAGGETDFPDLQVRVAPKRGRAVLFRNVLPSGEPDVRTLHAGLPVITGEKWLGTLWIRERPIRHV